MHISYRYYNIFQRTYCLLNVFQRITVCFFVVVVVLISTYGTKDAPCSCSKHIPCCSESCHSFNTWYKAKLIATKINTSKDSDTTYLLAQRRQKRERESIYMLICMFRNKDLGVPQVFELLCTNQDKSSFSLLKARDANSSYSDGQPGAKSSQRRCNRVIKGQRFPQHAVPLSRGVKLFYPTPCINRTAWCILKQFYQL